MQCYDAKQYYPTLMPIIHGTWHISLGYCEDTCSKQPIMVLWVAETMNKSRGLMWTNREVKKPTKMKKKATETQLQHKTQKLEGVTQNQEWKTRLQNK